jgi:hypothetical protein
MYTLTVTADERRAFDCSWASPAPAPAGKLNDLCGNIVRRLHALRQRRDLEVVGLLTTFNEEFQRVAMHAVRRGLVEAQAVAAGLPLIPAMLADPCTNEVYKGA